MTVRSFQLTCSGLARLAAGACLAASVLALSGSAAEARHHHYRLRPHYAARHRGSAAPRAVAAGDSNFSAIVVDANTGREIWGVNENGVRHPASITKVMTLYLLFEQLEKGNMTMDTMIPISAHAAGQEPSKLGIAAGDSLRVEDAIKAVVTRSANDVAVAIAEAVGHDEATFAGMMTRKAHSLGMSRTLYRNASGLPNDEQLTTAHDLTVLGRALQEHFPKYFHYFSTHEFTYDGEVIGNHNHLLGRVDGVDGIKTGYTRASGFNLLTSIHRDGRSLVAVVMGGRSAAARDHIMEQLISDHLLEASTEHTATVIAEETPETFQPRNPLPLAPAPFSGPVGVDAPSPHSHHVAQVDGEGDDSDDDNKSRTDLPAVVAAPPPLPPRLAIAAQRSPLQLGWVKGADPAKPAKGRKSASADDDDSADATQVAKTVAKTDAKSDAQHAAKGDWIIQIGAADNAAKANSLLIRAKAGDRTLASARPITEKFKKGGDVFYRARFAGLDSATASRTCRTLKRSGIPCFATRD